MKLSLSSPSSFVHSVLLQQEKPKLRHLATTNLGSCGYAGEFDHHRADQKGKDQDHEHVQHLPHLVSHKGLSTLQGRPTVDLSGDKAK